MGDPKDLYLKKTSAILKMYNGTTMTPLGKCTLKCAKSEMSREQIFFISDEDVRHLLGAETCQELNLITVMATDISDSETVNAVNDKALTAHIVLTRDQILKEYSDGFEGLGYNTIQYKFYCQLPVGAFQRQVLIVQAIKKKKKKSITN